jgi:DNA-binding NarL/FixJ family response regulator
MIRVVLADDHTVVRAGLAQLLSEADDIDVVGEAADGEAAVSLGTELCPDVMLMDLSMPELDGVEATRRVLAETGSVRVVVLTSFSDEERIVAALDAGVVGYLLEDAEPDDIVRGVRAAAQGESPLAPKAASAVLRARTTPPPDADLSAREREVLSLVARSLPNKLIARELEISEKTVKAHLTPVYQHIGVTDRTQAALWARERGLGEPGG